MLYLDSPRPIEPVDQNSKKCGIILGRRFHTYGPNFTLQVAPEFYHQSQLGAGVHVDLTLRFSQGKPPMIISDMADEKQLFLILTSRLTAASRHIGHIRAPRSQKVKVIMRAFAPPGTGIWETLVLRAKKGDAFYVNWNRQNGSEASNCFFYVAELDQVYAYPREHIPELFAGLGITPAFTLRDSPDSSASCLDRREWFKL